METQRPERRRKLLVRSRSQVRFVALLMLQMSIILASLGVVVYSHVNGMSVVAATVPLATTGDRLALHNELVDSVHVFYVRSLALIGVTTVILVLFGLLASHKLAGPIVKLERYLDAVADGDFSQKIAFRRNDHLDDFARSVNRAVEALAERRLRAREIGIELARTGRKLTDPGERPRAMTDLERQVAELRGAI